MYIYLDWRFFFSITEVQLPTRARNSEGPRLFLPTGLWWCNSCQMGNITERSRQHTAMPTQVFHTCNWFTYSWRGQIRTWFCHPRNKKQAVPRVCHWFFINGRDQFVWNATRQSIWDSHPFLWFFFFFSLLLFLLVYFTSIFEAICPLLLRFISDHNLWQLLLTSSWNWRISMPTVFSYSHSRWHRVRHCHPGRAGSHTPSSRWFRNRARLWTISYIQQLLCSN